MPISYETANILLGAGRVLIDRHDGKSGPTGKESYVGDTVAATVAATSERTTIFSGDGAVATKLIDKVTQIDRTMGITPQDATLDNMALFLIANAPETMKSDVAAASVTFTVDIPADVTIRDYFRLGRTAADPAGPEAFSEGAGNAYSVQTDVQTVGSLANPADGKFGHEDSDVEIDAKQGLLRIHPDALSRFRTDVANRSSLKVAVTGTKIVKHKFDRVAVDSTARQVRVAVRYVEEADEGVEGRNIYIPQASVSPAGEAALKSRDTEQQFALTLAIEEPSYDGAPGDQMYIDGVPA